MKGILFRPEMIIAIREGRKTQTRRVIKKLKEPNKWSVVPAIMGDGFDFYVTTNLSAVLRIKPRYKVGELVYIKEAYYCPVSVWIEDHCEPDGRTFYKLDNPSLFSGYWKSPLFMPAWAARYFIRITGVEAQRLQEISIDDCKAEGIHGYTLAKGCLSDNPPDQRWNFIELWDTINPKYPWNTNPWIFKYRFKLLDIKRGNNGIITIKL